MTDQGEVCYIEVISVYTIHPLSGFSISPDTLGLNLKSCYIYPLNMWPKQLGELFGEQVFLRKLIV